jgi:Adenylate and Guanylate cyclase catalytic domain
MAEARKTVTVVFADVSGSTELGERLDPEALRRIMERHFALVRETLERHGGTVEKFIGDAVMAVFGIPAAHEDDALRAVKAAAEIRERLHELNLALEGELGITLAIRTGINTGEVVAGDPASGQFYATGDTVNVVDSRRRQPYQSSARVRRSVDRLRQLEDFVGEVQQLTVLPVLEPNGPPFLVSDYLAPCVRSVLANHHEGRQEDRLERDDHRQQSVRVVLDPEDDPAREPGDVDVDEPHRAGEGRDPVGDPVLDALGALFGVLEKRRVRL